MQSLRLETGSGHEARRFVGIFLIVKRQEKLRESKILEENIVQRIFLNTFLFSPLITFLVSETFLSFVKSKG